ncbi:hypothetical protein ACFYVR_04245 [Rhodococcus sp. NPDC003318]|uniref:hypothetical protein n=1 Tax=Rhodococcus sp. NPDC003318 TaxID=3364503 RepID=UPI0036BBE7A0
MRKSTWTVITAGCAIALATAASPQQAHAVRPAHPGPAATAIEALTTSDPVAAAAAVPADFADVSGYRPVLRNGMLVNPRGDCSSPVPLPGEFDAACQGHDLGYDLLRYADRAGEQLGPWARQSLDRQFDERLHAACAMRPDDVTDPPPSDRLKATFMRLGGTKVAFGRAWCDAAATAAAAAVGANSWRQHYGAPRPEPITACAVGSGFALLAGAAAAHRGRAARNDRGRAARGVRSAQAVPA